MRPPKGLRDLVYARCDGYCEKCGYSMTAEAMCLHHRVTDSRRWNASNILALHGLCLNTHPDSIYNNCARSYETGFLIHPGGQSAEIPIFYREEEWVLLDDEGMIWEPGDLGERRRKTELWTGSDLHSQLMHERFGNLHPEWRGVS